MPCSKFFQFVLFIVKNKILPYKLAKWVNMIDRILISILLPSKLLIRKLRNRKLQILGNLPYIFDLGTLLLAECTLYVCNG